MIGLLPVPDPDLEIGGGGWSSRPLDKGGGRVSKKNYSALQFGLKIRGGWLPVPLPWIPH